MRYFWVPFNDPQCHQDVLERMTVADRILPFNNGNSARLCLSAGLDGTPGCWSDLNGGDELWISAHGRLSSCSQIAWLIDDIIIYWSAFQLVSALRRNLGNNGLFNLHYYLLNCFGADRWFLSTSFAEQCKKELTRIKFKGLLTAFHGCIGMFDRRNNQVYSGRMAYKLRLQRSRPITAAEKTWQL